jgi:tetratricopeptide (TPR) repeat protein
MEDIQEIVKRGMEFFNRKDFRSALGEFLKISEKCNPPGLDVHIFFCMKALKMYDEMIPYLETTVSVPQNSKNPDLWRMLGMLYLKFAKDLEKACHAFRKVMALDPLMLDRYPGLAFVDVYEKVKSSGQSYQSHIDVDLDTGLFSVRFSLQKDEDTEPDKPDAGDG